MGKSISTNQLIQDVKDLEVENTPTPDSLSKDLIHAAKNVKDSEQQIDDAIEGVLENVKKYGSSSHPDEMVRPLDAFIQMGFFIQVFCLMGKYHGFARSLDVDLIGRHVQFEIKDMNSAYGCGNQLVKLVKNYRGKK